MYWTWTWYMAFALYGKKYLLIIYDGEEDTRASIQYLRVLWPQYGRKS